MNRRLVEDASQPRPQLIEVAGAGFIRQPSWIPDDEGLERKKAVEPEDSVLDGSQNRAERGIHSATAHGGGTTAGGHQDDGARSSCRPESVLIKATAAVYTPHR